MIERFVQIISASIKYRVSKHNFQIIEITSSSDLELFFQTNSQRIYCHIFDSEIGFVNNDLQTTFFLKSIKNKITSFSKILFSSTENDQISDLQVNSSLLFKDKTKFIKLLFDTYFLQHGSSIYLTCDFRDIKFEYELDDFLALFVKFPQINDSNNYNNEENNESTSTSSNQQEILLIK